MLRAVPAGHERSILAPLLRVRDPVVSNQEAERADLNRGVDEGRAELGVDLDHEGRLITRTRPLAGTERDGPVALRERHPNLERLAGRALDVARDQREVGVPTRDVRGDTGEVKRRVPTVRERVAAADARGACGDSSAVIGACRAARR